MRQKNVKNLSEVMAFYGT